MTTDMPVAVRRRRPRRSQEEVLNLLRAAALRLFSERGFAGTTTQEIASLADVSETLLFRHFGGKAQLYDAVISAPFREIIEAFSQDRMRSDEKAEKDRDPHYFCGELFDFFNQNQGLFNALVLNTSGADNHEPVKLTGLAGTFDTAAAAVRESFASADSEPPFNVDVAVRLIFGMVGASVLFRPFLYSSDINASSGDVRECVKLLAARALRPN